MCLIFQGLEKEEEEEDKFQILYLGVCIDMDRISGLSDELLVKILLFLPTKLAISTSILSKRMVCFVSLETLQLENVTYFNEESLQRLISICPVLKRLSVDCNMNDNMGKFTVITHSL